MQGSRGRLCFFNYIRHGEPIYSPDSLEIQVEGVAKRLAVYGIDKIYSSTSERAILTAKPTCELTKKELTQLYFANEGYAWRDFHIDNKHGGNWLFQNPEFTCLKSRKLYESFKQ